MFSRYLKHSEYFSRMDVALFHAWETGILSTKKTLDKWLENNDIDKETVLLEAFETWMNSLGYYNEDTQKYMPTGCYKV